MQNPKPPILILNPLQPNLPHPLKKLLCCIPLLNRIITQRTPHRSLRKVTTPRLPLLLRPETPASRTALHILGRKPCFAGPDMDSRPRVRIRTFLRRYFVVNFQPLSHLGGVRIAV